MSSARGSEIEKSAARLRAIVDSAVDGIIAINERGQVEAFNQAAERMFGYSRDEVVGGNVSQLMPEADASRHDGYIDAYRRSGVPRIIGVGREVVGRRKDGSTFPLHLSVGEARFPGGRLFTGILRDLTRVKQLEREFLQAQKMEAVGRLASGLAHDFNNLLMGIIGCADVALSHLAEGHPSREGLEELRGAARRGGGLVRKLLAFSRKSRAESAVVDLNELVSTLEPMLTRLLGEDIELVVTCPPDPVWVACESGQAEQVLMNLVVNARHAMPEGGRLTITVELAREPDPAAVLVVEDTGCGMDEATAARVFEPFFTTRSDGEGTGLGLSTVYGIVTGSGGAIALTSAPGEGTRFRIRLPLSSTPVQVDEAAVEAEEKSEGETVLVVEDDKLVRMSLRHYLEKNGYRVLEVEDGEAALALVAAKTPISVILTDMVLPGITGSELVRRVQSPDFAHVFMSAHDPAQLRADGKIGAADVVLHKPFGEAELIAAIERSLVAARG